MHQGLVPIVRAQPVTDSNGDGGEIIMGIANSMATVRSLARRNITDMVRSSAAGVWPRCRRAPQEHRGALERHNRGWCGIVI